MNKKFYVTTPIYYPSAENVRFHIGTAYTTIFADSITKYKKLRGYDTYFVTGLDEHGKKVETVAKKRGVTPKEHVDEYAIKAEELWKLLGINYDRFIRTTEVSHESLVQEMFEKLLEQEDIYLGEYEGNYCMPCESFYTKTQLGEGDTCPECNRKTEIIKEESYFLKLSKYKDRLLKHIAENPGFIVPESKKKEVLSFLNNQELEDLCVSRTSFDWGVKVKSNPKHVVYVWIDALLNYLSALGLGTSDEGNYEKYWVENENRVHIMAKDILRFHTIYWPIMLMALDIKLPKIMYIHNFLVMKDGKMSKSKGNVIYPEELVSRYGVDALRYYLMSELSQSGDGEFTPEDYVNRINFDLANDLGNLVNRVIVMTNKYFDGKVKKITAKTNIDEFVLNLNDIVNSNIKEYENNFDEFKIDASLKSIWNIVRASNKFIDQTTPWILAKDESKVKELEKTLYYLLESIKTISVLIYPVLNDTSSSINKQIGVEKLDIEKLELGSNESYKVTSNPEVLFPRLDIKEETKFIQELMN